jgi:hypothetical protein
VNECHGTFGGCITRVTRLHADGTPIIAATASAISAGWSEISMEPDVSETDNWRQRLPSGMYVTHAEDRAQVEAVGLTMEFIQAEPALFELLGGGTAVVDWAGNIVGIAPAYRQATPVYVAVEVWAETPTPGKWSYWLLPFVSNAVFGAATFTDDVMTFAVTAKSGQNARWGVGPFNVVAVNAAGERGPLTMPLDATMTLYERTTTIPPPSGACAYTPYGSWLTPAVGTVTTPDPGLLPAESVIVYQRRGPQDGGADMNTLAAHFDAYGQYSWRFGEYVGPGGPFASVQTSGDGLGGVPGDGAAILPSTPPDQDEVMAYSHDLDDAGLRRATCWHQVDGVFVRGTSSTSPMAAVWDSTGPLRIGAWDMSQVAEYIGRIYSVELRTGLDPNDDAARYLMPHSVAVSPDTPDLAIGSERVRLTFRLSVDTFSSAFPSLLGKHGAEGREYLVYGYAGGVINGSVGSLTAPGNSDFSFYAAAPLGVPLTMAAEFQTGSPRITVTLNNGASYTTDLPVNANIFNTSGEVFIGSLDGNSSFRVYWAQLERLDAGGNVTGLVWRFDANEAPTDATTTTWTDPRGRTWSVNDPKYISGRTMWRFDADDYPGTGTTWSDPRGRTWTVTDPAAIVTGYLT